MSSLFITGTGTDIGKSAVSLALCMWGVSHNLKTVYFKPVQCGRFEVADGKEGGDSEWIKHISPYSIPTYVTYEFDNPVSPHLAASRENQPIVMDRIVQQYNEIQKQYELVVVEGAGGIAVPLDRKGTTMLDLIKLLDLPSLLVCSPGLGTLNHSILSHHYLSEKGAPPSGFVMCHIESQVPDIFHDNLKTIGDITHMPYWGELSYSEKVASGTRLTQTEAPSLFQGIAEAVAQWWKMKG
jgi:dethiobiotin synthetase